MTNLSIKCLKSEQTEVGLLYGQFSISNLYPGQAITVGNVLRRVLLSDIEGTTITAVRIAGITDEFSIIPGVREDVLELLLNLKGIIVKGKLNEPQFGRLKIQEPTVITASKIELPPELKIINSNHYIATTISSNILEIELKFESGTGYHLANQAFSDKSEDFLEMDKIFMPVQKVNFQIENFYNNLNQISEILIFEIWTNGSLAPEESIFEASKVIINLFNSILKTEVIDDLNLRNKTFSSQLINPYINVAIEELQLSVRAYNCLKRAQINTVGDLLKYSPEKLQELKNFGRKSADEVFVTLKNKLGIILK